MFPMGLGWMESHLEGSPLLEITLVSFCRALDVRSLGRCRASRGPAARVPLHRPLQRAGRGASSAGRKPQRIAAMGRASAVIATQHPLLSVMAGLAALFWTMRAVCGVSAAAAEAVTENGPRPVPERIQPVRVSTDLKKEQTHWAFQSVKRTEPPAVSDPKWSKTPLDLFILATLDAHGLHPAPSASAADLIRRVCFDLTGLPPSPEEIKAFTEDRSPRAYESLIDRLLDRPSFGERSAQPWLDLVRYAESEGFEYDRPLPDAWRYRDYVINAFNQDKPFNRFLTEQIAGDEISPNNPETQTATVFHRLGPVRRNAGNPEIALSRNEILTERTDVIGAAVLGLTVGCARCHDHKFDPIPQRDYYQLQAYLAGTQEYDLLLVSTEEERAWKERSRVITGELKRLRHAVEKAEGAERQTLEKQIEEQEGMLPPSPATIPGIRNVPEQRTEIHVLKRGLWESKGERVGPRPLSALVQNGFPELPADSPKPRTELARWLTDPNNPLTPRVVVNRIWQQHFGMGLVKTANDFGANGDRPSHPELLDWMASELVSNGWKLKPLHRMILLSSAYQQASRSPTAGVAMALDPENRWLWQFNRRRLSAEEIRDAMLAVSGRLNRKQGGRASWCRWTRNCWSNSTSRRNGKLPGIRPSMIDVPSI